jgi:dolichol-phosphate mannosyltransferase
LPHARNYVPWCASGLGPTSDGLESAEPSGKVCIGTRVSFPGELRSAKFDKQKLGSMVQSIARPANLMATIAAPALEGPSVVAPGPRLTIVMPTRNEHDNIRPVYDALCRVLKGIDWEVIFIDDDSNDGTAEVVCRLANSDGRVRRIQRIGRRGLASACVEGILASSAPYVAVMDADLQHDEQLLPRMLETLISEPHVDVVVGSRYVEHGSIATLSRERAFISGLGTRIARSILEVPLTDPMSGFFMVRRETFEGAVRRLSRIGFKILLDLLASSPRPLQVKEIPYHFRERHSGESKFDALIGWEYLMLLADKAVGHIIPIRFLVFALVGGLGLGVHLAVLWLCLNRMQLSFELSQAAATGIAIIGNFTLNNWFTYHDRRLAGWQFVRGLLSFALICSFGAVANVGVATLLFTQQHTYWWVAGIAGAAMSAVWNYAVSSTYTWRA